MKARNNDKRFSFGWSKQLPVEDATYIPIDQLKAYLVNLKGMPITTIGNNRSYGDACVGTTRLSAQAWKCIVSFDEISGVIVAESGVTLHELLQITMPRSWFLHVTPGTRYITLGGAVASDVHGKNHPIKGNFSSFVLYFDLMVGSGEVIRCSKSQNARLFWLTCGGMGNTGIILMVAFQLRMLSSLRMDTYTEKCPDFESVFHSLSAHPQWEYASAWVDFMGKGKHYGRGIGYFARHAATNHPMEAQDAKPPRSVLLPTTCERLSWFLRPSTLRLFNRWRYVSTASGEGQASIFEFLYPLDKIKNWNILYGKKGFLQYHCCVPQASALEVFLKFKDLMQQSRWFPYLAVLKKHQNSVPENINAFSIQGYSLALDFPHHPTTFQLFSCFDTLLLAHGGRIYLAKDACSDPRLAPLHLDTFADTAFGSFQKDRLV